MNNIIETLLTEAKNSDLDQWGTKFAFMDLENGRLCVTISYHNGGDGQERKINARTEWVYAGKTISRENLDALNLAS